LTTGSATPRRRRAARAPESSDASRRRAWLAAALAGALAVVVALALRDGPRSLGAPGPLARPHAALACASCHATRSEPAASRCPSCHGAHPSVRPAHRELASAGVLACPSCHALHENEDGVALEPGGGITLYGTGFERAVAADLRSVSGPVSTAAALVPLVRKAACTRCHDAASDVDPAAHCLPKDGSFALCFDEHRRVAQAGGSVHARRDAAIERARAVARGTHARGGTLAALGADALCVTVGLGVAGLVLALDRRRRRWVPALSRPLVPLPAARRLPVIDAKTCLGCHACVDACPYDALVVRRYVAVLERAEACCGAGPCQDSCPNGSLRLVEGGARSVAVRLSESLESLDQPGIFLAGDVTGGSLVRNALRQGAAAARAAAARISGARAEGRRDGGLDLVIVGAGPAGLSAALTARALGLRILVLEQSRLAASIQSFSRDKLVLDAPSAADETLPLFVGDVRKEELVQRWERTIRAARVPVREGARVLEVVRAGLPGFRIRAELAGGTLLEETATLVLLSTGTRGTARELEARVAEEARARVHYELSDARAFAGRRVVVIGLGDVAMESALALAGQTGADVTILYRGAGFRRGKRRNIEALSALVAAGKARLVFDAHVERISRFGVEARVGRTSRCFPCDDVFVHVGHVASHELLARTGVCKPSAGRVALVAWDLAQHDKPSS